MNNKTKFAEDMTAFGLVILTLILLIVMMTSCSQPKHGYDYKSHAKSNAKWKHKQETNTLPKCKRN